MKTRRFLWVFFMVLSFIVLCSMLSKAQPLQAQVPGDDFSLEGALELFKKSTSPEDFERQLNSANSRVNNLDLNGDGDIDYIRVIDRNERNVHAFIIQAIISERESQDVAVIELEKLDNGKAVLQIIGDADVYGIETIIEPTTEVRVNAGTSTARTVENVWAWPSVQYVYSPYYVGWVSPYRWSVRPIWWSAWRPVAYYTYNPWWQPYRSYYTVCYTHRVGYAQQLYRPMRTTSFVVYSRHYDQIAHYRMNQNNDRYSGQRNDRSGNYNAGNSGVGNGYGQRDNNERDNNRGRSTTQNGNQSKSMTNQQSNWRSNQGSSIRQEQGLPTRIYSADRMNRTGDQINARQTFPKQNQQRRATDFERMPERVNRTNGTVSNLNQGGRPTDFQRVPQAASRMNGMSDNSNDRQLNIPRGQVGAQRDLGSRQSPSFNNPGNRQQLRQPSINQGESRSR